MGKPYSQDLRDRVLAAVAEGSSARAAAARFGVGVATAIVWARRLKDTGGRSAHRLGKPRGCKLDMHEGFLLGLILETPDMTLHEMQARLRDHNGVHAAIGSLWRFFDQRGVTLKKNGTRV